MILIMLLLNSIATPGEDYIANLIVLQALAAVHGPGSNLCFQIPIIDDDVVEAEECFAVTISLDDTGLMVAIADDAAVAICCIQDNDG